MVFDRFQVVPRAKHNSASQNFPPFEGKYAGKPRLHTSTTGFDYCGFTTVFDLSTTALPTLLLLVTVFSPTCLLLVTVFSPTSLLLVAVVSPTSFVFVTPLLVLLTTACLK